MFRAVNKLVGDNARNGAVKKRTQLKNPLTKTSTKRNKKGGSSGPSRRPPRSSKASVGDVMGKATLIAQAYAHRHCDRRCH
jgi:hypothetical protein